jgi:hypothetical protein
MAIAFVNTCKTLRRAVPVGEFVFSLPHVGFGAHCENCIMFYDAVRVFFGALS